MLREELGDVGAFLPGLALDRGRPQLRSPRIELDWLVPEFMRSVVRRPWCEGMITAAGTDGADVAQQAAPGIRCGVGFPENLGAEGAFDPSAWSLDFTWDP